MKTRVSARLFNDYVTDAAGPMSQFPGFSLPQKIAVLSYGFSDNVGDNAILESILEAAAEQGVSTVFALDFGARQAVVACPSTLTLVRVPAMNPFRILWALCQSQGVLLGGGGIIQHTTSPYNLLYFSGLACLARLLLKPLWVLRVGINDIDAGWAKCLVRCVLNQARQVSVRDAGSLQRATKQVNVRRSITVAPDPVFYRRFHDDRVGAEIVEMAREPFLLFAIRPPVNLKGGIFRKASDRYRATRLPHVAESVRPDIRKIMEDALTASGIGRAIFVPSQYPRDRQLASAVLRSYQGADITVIDRAVNFDELQYLAARAYCVVSSRYHACIAALKVHARLIALDNYKIGNLVQVEGHVSPSLLIKQAGYHSNTRAREQLRAFCETSKSA